MDALIAAAGALQSFGPYFLVVVLGYAYWQREAYVKELHKQNLSLSQEHIKASAEMTHAITNLIDAVGSLKDLLQTLINKS